jgi:uncharacterized protein YdhG (YjbR/CyaY superfamily)
MAADIFATSLKKFPKDQQKAILATLVAAEKLFPKSTRAIAWGMPTLKIGEENLCHVFGFKEHNSLFPASGGVASMLKKDLAKYKVSKGTIQFNVAKPFPKPLLKKILLARLNQINNGYPRKNGLFIEFYKNGGIKVKGKYKGHKMNGKWEFFRIDGSIMRSGSFKDGKQSGEWLTYDKNGRKVKVTKF